VPTPSCRAKRVGRHSGLDACRGREAGVPGTYGRTDWWPKDPADRRRTIVAIPKSKERAVNHGLLSRANHLRRTLDRLTPQQRDGLITGLNTLTEELAKGHR
jgi:transposase